MLQLSIVRRSTRFSENPPCYCPRHNPTTTIIIILKEPSLPYTQSKKKAVNIVGPLKQSDASLTPISRLGIFLSLSFTGRAKPLQLYDTPLLCTSPALPTRLCQRPRLWQTLLYLRSATRIPGHKRGKGRKKATDMPIDRCAGDGG